MNALAKDACRVCFIMPKWMRDEISAEIDSVNTDFSSVMRKIVYGHIVTKKRKESRRNG